MAALESRSWCRRYLRGPVSAFILVAVGVNAGFAAPPEVSALFPAGGARGTNVAVTAAGKFERWPVRAWVDEPGAVFEPGKEKGTFTVRIAPDAPTGLRLARFFDDTGASALVPFLIGALPEIIENEPNNELDDVQETLSLPLVINGRFARRNDVDAFPVSLARGKVLVVALEGARRLGSPMDGVLQIVSSDGFVLQQQDDSPGLDPLLVFEAPEDGRYVVRAFAFPATATASISFAGGEDYIYRLTLTTEGALDFTLPVPGSVSGRIVGPGEHDRVQVALKKGQTVRAQVEARAIGSPLDPVLTIADEKGTTLNEQDDAGRNDRDPAITFTAPSDGTFLFGVHDLHGFGSPRAFYRLDVREPRPTFELSVKNDRITVEPGKPAKVEVAIARTGGFAEPVSLEVIGLAEGITASRAISEPRGPSAKSVTITLESTQDDRAFSGPVLIVGRGGGTERAATTNGPAATNPDALWLTVIPKK